mgnify:CR=1 FL=1|tara:strand:+ start:63 stop:347 length:285 start_codon:yes stop_codon:yes gene_type:complete
MSINNRLLAQIFLSKIGGNVDHNVVTTLMELFDNAIDANCTKINYKIIEEKDKHFLTLYDNGEGIKDLPNLLNATKGKKNKIGKKNQGFIIQNV